MPKGQNNISNICVPLLQCTPGEFVSSSFCPCLCKNWNSGSLKQQKYVYWTLDGVLQQERHATIICKIVYMGLSSLDLMFLRLSRIISDGSKISPWFDSFWQFRLDSCSEEALNLIFGNQDAESLQTFWAEQISSGFKSLISKLRKSPQTPNPRPKPSKKMTL